MQCVKSDYATQTTKRFGHTNGYAIVTKDEDFFLRVLASETGPSVVWLRVGNTSNTALRVWFAPQIPRIVELLTQGSRLVEIR